MQRSIHITLALMLVAISAQANAREWFVRDAITGTRIAAQLKINCPGSEQVLRAFHGRTKANLGTNGLCSVLVSQPGYHNLRTRFHGSSPSLPTTLWLDPVASNKANVAPPSGAAFQGWIYDLDTGAPIPNAVISLENRGVGTTTSIDGSFQFTLNPESRAPDEAPASDTLIVRADDYAEYHLEVFVQESVTSLIIDLQEADGVTAFASSHKMLDHSPIYREPPPQIIGKSTGDGQKLAPVDPPASIRVGVSCSCTSCSSVAVMSLETYVKRGLNDEWIASWDEDSLRAGAVAYRSYGAWYVAHPLSAGYDICSTTCCQVNDSDTSLSTDNAAEFTAGFMLETGGAVFRSEYSAEINAWDDPEDGLSCSNSDLSCGDGFAGSPDAGWPCLQDSQCAGHGCFGHGRGMCQWGSQRLASTANKNWVEIIDHYYNDDGAGTGSRVAHLTTPLWIDNTTLAPVSVDVGSKFRINLEITSGAENSHPEIVVGASLYSEESGWISDPDNDAEVTLDPGANQVFRLFKVPEGTPLGEYDLLVSLYFDTNDDGDITPADKNLDLVALDAAITVIDSDAIFRDDFESGGAERWQIKGSPFGPSR